MGKFIDLTGQRFNNLVILSRATKPGQPIKWKCQCDCGNIFEARGNDIKNGKTKSCGCLRKKQARNLNFKDITNQRFGRLVALKNTHNGYWQCQCDCGNICEVKGSALRSGNTQSCGCLKHTSIGEEIIANLLIENNINFKRQFTFPDLFSPKGSLLRFDFGVYNEQGTLKYLIEYDGIQHYMPVEYFGGQYAFSIQQEHDKRKSEYAKCNNFKLIVIPYWDYGDIEEILSRELGI